MREYKLIEENIKILKFNRQKYSYLFFILPSLIGVFFFSIIPLTDVFRRSFIEGSSGNNFIFKHYTGVIENDAFKLAVSNTLKFEVLCLPLLIVISLITAVAVSNMNHNIIKFAFLVPLAIPSNSVAVMWKILFDKSGIINGFLTDLFHIEAINFLNGNNALYVLVFTYIWKNIGYNMFIWMAGLNAIPKSIYEAAVVDGADDLQQFFKITIPNLKGTLYAVAVLSFVNSFKVFREAYLIAGNYPDEKIYMLQHLFNNWFGKLAIGKLAAAAVMTAFAIFIVLIVLKKLLLENHSKVNIQLKIKKHIKEDS